MKKLYVGCALTNVPPELRDEFLSGINRLKSTLREHFEILEFLGDAAGSARATYQRDIVECVGVADYMLAICDYPSTGLGYEMGTAIEKHEIPVIAAAHHSSKVTRLIQDIPKKYVFLRYDKLEELAQRVAGDFLFTEAISQQHDNINGQLPLITRQNGREVIVVERRTITKDGNLVLSELRG